MGNTISTFMGTGSKGYTGDVGFAQDEKLNDPFHVDLDPTEKILYVADCFNFRIRSVDITTGKTKNFAGNGIQGHTGDGGLATEASIDEIYAIQADINGDVYICQRFNPCIRKISSETGIISSIAGTGKPGSGPDNIKAVESHLMEPNDCFLDGRGGLLIADIKDQKVRKVDLNNGIISTFAGTGAKEHTGDGEPASQAGIFGARAVCVDDSGNTYICEREGNTIRKVNTEGIITKIAGTGEKGYTGDGGPALKATFNGPKAIRCTKDGNLLVVDTENHAIRIIDMTSLHIYTIAGGTIGPHGDSKKATEAGLSRPHGVVTSSTGMMYIADSENHRIRVVN